MTIDELRAKVVELLPCEDRMGLGQGAICFYDTSGNHTRGCPAYYRPTVEAALAECEAKLNKTIADWERTRADDLAERNDTVAELRGKLAEYEQQSRLDKNDLNQFLKIITDLGLEFAPSEKVQWRNRKAIDLERKLAECERENEQLRKIKPELLALQERQRELEREAELLHALLDDAQRHVARILKLEKELAECERKKDELREKLVELALKLAAHETAEDRKRILESEDVRSIMDLRLR